MKLLLIHSDYIEYEVKDKAISNPEVTSIKKDRLDEALTVFIAVEKNDEKSPNQTKIVISSPSNKSYVPKIACPIIVFAFFLFFITQVIRVFQDFIFTIGSGVSVVGLAFTSLVSIIFLSRFVIVAENDKVLVGREFWKFNRFTTIAKYQITNIRWDIQGPKPEHYPSLIVETSFQKHQFQPLRISITQSKPRPELQQFLDSFLQELNDVIMK